jgi:hypothetical protein
MKKKTSLPRIEDQAHYRKVGRLRKPVADEIGKPAANIYVDENHLKHIFINHKNELAQIGFTPIMFLDTVLNNFNRIYKGNRNALILVKWNGTPKVAVIELNLALRKGFYEVLTAYVRAKGSFKNAQLLWEK